MFSKAGKEILLKSVIQSIPNYSLSCFMLPKSIIKDIYRLMASFWWGKENGKNKIHWGRWDTLCKPKDSGGMGFKDLECFNQAFLAKQGWRILKNPQLLVSKILKSSYFRNSNFLEAKCGGKASYVWRSLLWGKELLAKGCIWRVGSGENIRILKNNWVATKNESFTNPPFIPDDVSVADLRLANGEWNREFIETLFDPVDVKKFMFVPVGLIDNQDFLAWLY